MTDPTYETPVRLVSPTAWASWQTVLIDLRAARADWQERTDRARGLIATKAPPEQHGTAANLLEVARRAGHSLLLDDVAARSTALSVQRDEILAWLAVQQECCELAQGRRFMRVDDLRFGAKKDGALDNEAILRFAAPLLENASFDEWFEALTALRFRLDPEPEGYGYGDRIIAFLWRVLRVIAEEGGRPCPDEPSLEEVPPIADVGRALDTARNWLLTTPDAPATIVSLGDMRYRVGEVTQIVTDREDWVLASFLNRSPLMKVELAEVSGLEGEEAAKVLRALKGNNERKGKYNNIFAACIKMPGKRSAGGYHVSIRDTE